MDARSCRARIRSMEKEQNATGHIVLVEDDPLLAGHISRKLVEKGFRVTLAKDGEAGLSAIIREKPDLVLLDMMLPFLSGFDILEDLYERKILPDLPVVIVSNSGQPIEIERAMKLGVVDHVIKLNLSPEDIVYRVERAILNNKKTIEPAQ
jgi:DNA-binding response OmpR family regulator